MREAEITYYIPYEKNIGVQTTSCLTELCFPNRVITRTKLVSSFWQGLAIVRFLLIVCLFVETCSCYKFYSNGSVWNENRKSCQKAGGDLVSMETDDEWEFVKNLTQHKTTDDKDSDDWHIGLMRFNGIGNWTWVSGKPLTIKRWQENEPWPNDGTETVAVIAKNYPAGAPGLFNDLSRDASGGYICELPRGE